MYIYIHYQLNKISLVIKQTNERANKLQTHSFIEIDQHAYTNRTFGMGHGSCVEYDLVCDIVVDLYPFDDEMIMYTPVRKQPKSSSYPASL